MTLSFLLPGNNNEAGMPWGPSISGCSRGSAAAMTPLLLKRHRRLVSIFGVILTMMVLCRLGGISISIQLWGPQEDLWDASIRDRELDYDQEVIMTADDRKALSSNRARALFPRDFVEYDTWQTIAPLDFRRVPKYPCFSDVGVLVVVWTTATHYDMRTAIRSTWGLGQRGTWPQGELQDQVQVIFALGVDPDTMWEEYVGAESERHGDILQGTSQAIWNTAHSLPTFIFKWAKEYCHSARFLCYVNDDMFVNVPHLLQSLNFENLPHTFLIPYLIVHQNNHTRVEPVDVIRYGHQSREVFVISADLSGPLYTTMKASPLLVEHTAVACAAYARGFGSRVMPSADLMEDTSGYVRPCDVIEGRVTVITGMTAATMTKFWSELVTSRDECW